MAYAAAAAAKMPSAMGGFAARDVMRLKLPTAFTVAANAVPTEAKKFVACKPDAKIPSGMSHADVLSAFHAHKETLLKLKPEKYFGICWIGCGGAGSGLEDSAVKNAGERENESMPWFLRKSTPQPLSTVHCALPRISGWAGFRFRCAFMVLSIVSTAGGRFGNFESAP